MKQLFASIVTMLLTIALTLAAMYVLVDATLRVTAIASPLQRALALAAEVVLGIVLLLGTVWVATHLAVRIFHVEDSPAAGEPRA
jgi:hypothetical protein